MELFFQGERGNVVANDKLAQIFEELHHRCHDKWGIAEDIATAANAFLGLKIN